MERVAAEAQEAELRAGHDVGAPRPPGQHADLAEELAGSERAGTAVRSDLRVPVLDQEDRFGARAAHHRLGASAHRDLFEEAIERGRLGLRQPVERREAAQPASMCTRAEALLEAYIALWQ